MDLLDMYATAAFEAVGLVFVFIRRIPYYAAGCILSFLLFAWFTRGWIAPRTGEWIVMAAGLLLFSFGLLIVRVMLIRSVSLQLLRTLASSSTSSAIGEDVGVRLQDMSYFRLIHLGEHNRLTAFGRFCSTVVVIFYTIFRIK